MSIEKLRFKPWIGNYYEENENGKILLVGESHYLDGEDITTQDFTTAVINEYLSDGNMQTPFFKRIGQIFDRNDFKAIWAKVAFANLIQSGLSNSSSQPTKDDIATINPAFEILLNDLRPNKVIVLSKRLWNFWLTEENAQFIGKIKANGKSATVWEYIRDGHSTIAMGIWHPSRMFGNSCYDWTPLVEKFLKTY